MREKFGILKCAIIFQKLWASAQFFLWAICVLNLGVGYIRYIGSVGCNLSLAAFTIYWIDWMEYSVRSINSSTETFKRKLKYCTITFVLSGRLLASPRRWHGELRNQPVSLTRASQKKIFFQQFVCAVDQNTAAEHIYNFCYINFQI